MRRRTLIFVCWLLFTTESFKPPLPPSRQGIKCRRLNFDSVEHITNRIRCLLIPSSISRFQTKRGTPDLNNHRDRPRLNVQNNFQTTTLTLSNAVPKLWSKESVLRPLHVKILRKGDTVERKYVSDFTKSLVFVNDTYRCALRTGMVPLGGKDAYRDRRDDEKMLFTLLGEFRFESPGYLHLLPKVADGDENRLWITNFGMTIGGSVFGIDVSGRYPARKCKAPFVWPNAAEFVPSGYFSGINTSAILVADGFLVPGKTKGNVWLVVDPGGEKEKAVRLAASNSWFYHKAVPIKINGHEGVLTARAHLPILPFSSALGELVWIEKPNTLNPTASWNLPWREVVLAEGPDVMFEVVDLDPDDQSIEVFASEFFSRKLTMHSIMWDDGKNCPVVVERQVVDDNLGQAYSVAIADLQGEKSHIIVTTHEYEADPSLDKSLFNWLPGTSSTWTYTSSPAPMGSRSIQNDNCTVGGSMFAYQIPKTWRKNRQFAELTEEELNRRLPELFRQLDKSKEGYLDQTRIEKALQAIGVAVADLKDGELSKMMQDVDWDGSGELDYEQFKSIVYQVYKNSKRGLNVWAQAMKRFESAMGLSAKNFELQLSSVDVNVFQSQLPTVFQQIDEDGSGAIDMDEMRQAIQSVGVTCSNVELAAMFVEADWDANGLIDYAEFENLMMRIFLSFRNNSNVFSTALNRLEAALKSTLAVEDTIKWQRSTLASGFRVKRVSINPGAPGFAYTFYPHASMCGKGPPHILLAGDCADAAYVFKPVHRLEDDRPQYDLVATLAFEGTVGSIAVGQISTENSLDDGWTKFFVPVYETDRVYMFKFGPPPEEGVEPSW